MKIIKLVIAALTLIPAFALADPAVSSDAGRSLDNTQQNSIKRDQSLSADKAHGRRRTLSDSEERSREASRSRSHQEAVGTREELSNSYSADISINGLLLREFTARYERGNNGSGSAWEYFHLCKPLMNSQVDYPVWDLTAGGVVGLIEARRSRTRDGYVMLRGDSMMKPQIDPTNRYISRYSQCRMTTSYWLSQAGDRTTRQQVTTENQVRDRIRQVFAEMDADESLFQDLRQRARDVWAQAVCSPWIDTLDNFKAPEIECSVFTFSGGTMTVENRETLSEASIDGRSYKVSVSASQSESVSTDDTVARDARESVAARESDTRDRFAEQKNTATLSTSKSKDRSRSRKVDRSVGNSVSATPTK